jgi:hypothetical protein
MNYLVNKGVSAIDKGGDMLATAGDAMSKKLE